MPNPFESYQSPEIDKIFSSEFKEELLNYKLSQFGSNAVKQMLEDGIVPIIDGETVASFTYDCGSMIKIGLADDKLEASQHLGKALFDSFELAKDMSTEITGDVVGLQIEVAEDAHNPRLTNFEMSVLEE